jgi:hypothetical protein
MESHLSVLHATMLELGITNHAVFVSWVEDKRNYLQMLHQEPTGEDILKMEYVMLLRKLETTK